MLICLPQIQSVFQVGWSSFHVYSHTNKRIEHNFHHLEPDARLDINYYKCHVRFIQNNNNNTMQSHPNKVHCKEKNILERSNANMYLAQQENSSEKKSCGSLYFNTLIFQYFGAIPSSGN